MQSRWPLRLFFAAVVVGVLWLATVFTSSPQLEIHERDRSADEREDETMSGEGVVYREYDLAGNQKILVDAAKGRQLGDAGWQLEGSKAQWVSSNGRVVTLYSDTFQERADGTRLIESTSDRPIRVVEEDGLIFQTRGPVVVSGDQFHAVARIDFQWGLSIGHANEILFQPGVHLKLIGDVGFQVLLPQGEARMLARELTLDVVHGIGQMDQASINVQADLGTHVSLVASSMQFLYEGNERGVPQNLREFHGLGKDTRLEWSNGRLMASRFTVCMGPEGRWVEWAESVGETRFSLQTEDRYRLDGTTRDLVVAFELNEPQKMTGNDPVSASGIDAQGSEFKIDSKGGLEAIFHLGRVRDSLILGEPVFAFKDLSGHAGHIRLLHQEARILLGAGAALSQNDELQVTGEEILIANWNLDQKEIFARTFVRFAALDEDGRDLIGEGEQVSMQLPSRQLTLLGTPASFRQGSDILKAERVEVAYDDEGERLLRAEGHLTFEVDVGGQIASTEAEVLLFDESLSVARFTDVKRAELPGFGTITAREMNVQLDKETRAMNLVEGSGLVTIEGSFERDAATHNFSAQADAFRYDATTEVAVLIGKEREVVLHLDEGQSHRSRQLTFNFRDGSMLAGSNTHEYTKTIINIKDKKEGE